MTPAKPANPTKTGNTVARRAPAAKKAIAKPAKATKPAKPAKPTKPAKPGKAETTAVKTKPVKIKPVRDSFTFPKNEYLMIDALKKRAVAVGHPSKKSELLRAGIKALSAMADAAFASAIRDVPTIKTGRPGKS